MRHIRDNEMEQEVTRNSCFFFQVKDYLDRGTGQYGTCADGQKYLDNLYSVLWMVLEI